MLVAVHVHKESLRSESRRLFNQHVEAIAEEAKLNFAYAPLELCEHHLPPLLTSMAFTLNSTNGKLNSAARRIVGGVKDVGIVLVGTYFGMCHLQAYKDLIDVGVQEIHIPQDCTNGFTKSCYPEHIEKAADLDFPGDFLFKVNPLLDVTKEMNFPRYVGAVRKCSAYRLFVPKRVEAFAASGNGSNPLLVMFHSSWREMMDFFEERK